MLRSRPRAVQVTTRFIVLSCTASYPADPADSNLRGIRSWRTPSTPWSVCPTTRWVSVPAVAAVALGACAIEKHVDHLARGRGVDSAFSLEPDELAALVRETETARISLGAPRIGATASETEGLRLAPFLVHRRGRCRRRRRHGGQCPIHPAFGRAGARPVRRGLRDARSARMRRWVRP